MRILVTGASGFVGRHLVSAIDEHEVLGAVRRGGSAPSGSREIVVGDIGPETDWDAALEGVDAVVHLAARVHVMDEVDPDPLAAFREVNVAGTARLAEASAKAGVRRLIFLSSIKVHGEATFGAPFSSGDEARPSDPYGVSKREAEIALEKVASTSKLGVVILRPPVIYGEGVGGNIRRIATAIANGVPLPLRSIRNRRTMLSVENLVVAIRAAISLPEVPGGPILLGDTSPVSTADLARYLSYGMGVHARLLPCPAKLLSGLAAIVGRRSDVLRLTQDLVVDSNWRDLGVDEEILTSSSVALERLGRGLALERRSAGS